MCYKPQGRCCVPDPCSRCVALRSTQTLTQLSTSNFVEVNENRPVPNADNLTAICEPTVTTQCGILDVSQPYRSPPPVTEIDLLEATEEKTSANFIVRTEFEKFPNTEWTDNRQSAVGN
jgi:hypothetical protein